VSTQTIRAAGSRHMAINATLIIICQSMQALAFGGVALLLPLIRDDVHITFSQAGTLAAVGTFTYAPLKTPRVNSVGDKGVEPAAVWANRGRVHREPVRPAVAQHSEHPVPGMFNHRLCVAGLSGRANVSANKAGATWGSRLSASDTTPRL